MKIDWKRINEIAAHAINDYEGDLGVLESAVGALIMGQFYGWRVLRIIHTGRTYSRYEKILGIKFNELCPARTPLSRRNNGYRWTEDFGNYWKAVNHSLIPVEVNKEIASKQLGTPVVDGAVLEKPQ